MRCYDACDMIWVEFLSQTLASYVMLRVHRVEVIFWWFKVLGNLQGAHCEYQKALDGNKSDSYAHKAVDGPRKFMAWTARSTSGRSYLVSLGARARVARGAVATSRTRCAVR